MYKLIKRKGYQKSLLLFKEWFLKEHKKSGPLYKWNSFLRWNDSQQSQELRKFIYETQGKYSSTKLVGKSFKLIVNSKTKPRPFKNDLQAYSKFITEEFRNIEIEIKRDRILTEKLDKIEHQKALKEEKALKILKESEEEKAKEKQLQRINQREAYIKKQKEKES